MGQSQMKDCSEELWGRFYRFEIIYFNQLVHPDYRDLDLEYK